MYVIKKNIEQKALANFFIPNYSSVVIRCSRDCWPLPLCTVQLISWKYLEVMRNDIQTFQMRHNPEVYK